MRFFASPPLIVNEVMAWANRLFGGHLPLLPFPPGWGTLAALWRADIVGDLPNPDDPKPWHIAVEGTWQPFTTCAATLDSLEIVIVDVGGRAPSLRRTVSKPRAPRRVARAPRKKRTFPARRARTPGPRGLNRVIRFLTRNSPA
jgi:hypothetical protein